jgi:hypothetical protein
VTTKWMIVDIDGTLSDCSHRNGLARERRWDEFHGKLGEDACRPAERALVQAWYQSSPLHRVALATARPEMYREATMAWLEREEVPYHELHMRPDGDRTPSEILKVLIWLELFRDRNVVVVLEDRDKVVDMWRRVGLTCFQVQRGEY